MRRGNIFWGFLLLGAGALFLLSNLEIIEVNVWGVLWPLIIIALGLWIVFGRVYASRGGGGEQLSIPIQGAERGRLRIRHGAGRLSIRGGAESEEAVAGSFEGGVDVSSRVSGNEVSIGLKVPRLFFGGFPTFRPLIWSLRLNEQIPLSLDVEAGANETRIDLEALKIEDLRLKTGASDTRVTLPAAAGMTKVRIEAGAASVRVRVPEGVAARIRAEAGLAEISVDQTRFPKQDGTYLSADYEEAENKADLHLSAGVGAIDVR